MKSSFSSELLTKMFTWSQYIDAIIELEVALGKYKDATVDNLDLILKWITLRLFDIDVNILSRTLEYLKKLISVLLISGNVLFSHFSHHIICILILRIHS
jgi:hypothetical protein